MITVPSYAGLTTICTSRPSCFTPARTVDAVSSIVGDVVFGQRRQVGDHAVLGFLNQGLRVHEHVGRRRGLVGEQGS